MPRKEEKPGEMAEHHFESSMKGEITIHLMGKAPMKGHLEIYSMGGQEMFRVLKDDTEFKTIQKVDVVKITYMIKVRTWIFWEKEVEEVLWGSMQLAA